MFNKVLSNKRRFNVILETYYSHFKLAIQIGLLVFLLGVSAIVQAKDTKSILSPEELKKLSLAMENIERGLLNIKIESEAWIETKASLTDPCEPWKRTPVYVSSTAWFDGRPSGKVKVDVHKQVLKWRDGAAPYAESRYSVGFDGKHGRVVNHTTGERGKTHPVKEGRLLSHTPRRLTTGWSGRFTGSQFSLNYFFSGKGYTFSDLFRWADDPCTLVPSSFQFTQEVFQGVQTIKIASKGTKSKGWQKISWLDPSRGFALLGHKSTASFEDGTERLVSFSKVSKLKEVAPGIWWPMEASMVSRPYEPGEPYERFVYRASNVVANDPNFDGSVFTVPFPEGYLIDDQVTGKKYIIGKK